MSGIVFNLPMRLETILTLTMILIGLALCVTLRELWHVSSTGSLVWF